MSNILQSRECEGHQKIFNVVRDNCDSTLNVAWLD